jgi:hypothetical protein
MLLVGAVAIAVLVFGVVVVLNTMVYTTSVKPQASIEAAEETMTAEQVVRRDLKRFMRGYAGEKPYINQSETGRFEANLTRYERRWAESVAQRTPATVSVDLNRTASDSAALVRQSTERKYRDRNNTNDWNLTDSGELTSVHFEFDAKTAASFPQATTLTVRNDTTNDWWRFKVWDVSGAPSTVRIEILDDDGNTATCDVLDGETVVINETAISTPSNTCAIDFARGVPSPYSVRIANGEKLEGTYALGLTNAKESRLGNGPASQPYVDDLLTEAAFDFTYVTPEVDYESTVRIDIRTLMVPRIGATEYLDRESGVTVRNGTATNRTVVAYDYTNAEARESYRSLIAPESGALLVYDDFESGSPGTWTVTGGTGGVDDDARNTGRYALYHNGGGDGTLNRTPALDTTGYDALVVSYWAQEGLPGGPTAGPEPKEDENMTLQYYNASGVWKTVDRTRAVDAGPPVRYDRRVYINASDAGHDAFRIRFVTPADAPSDHWYVDDVRILGREEG